MTHGLVAWAIMRQHAWTRLPVERIGSGMSGALTDVLASVFGLHVHCDVRPPPLERAWWLPLFTCATNESAK